MIKTAYFSGLRKVALTLFPLVGPDPVRQAILQDILLTMNRYRQLAAANPRPVPQAPRYKDAKYYLTQLANLKKQRYLLQKAIMSGRQRRPDMQYQMQGMQAQDMKQLLQNLQAQIKAMQRLQRDALRARNPYRLNGDIRTINGATSGLRVATRMAMDKLTRRLNNNQQIAANNYADMQLRALKTQLTARPYVAPSPALILMKRRSKNPRQQAWANNVVRNRNTANTVATVTKNPYPYMDKVIADNKAKRLQQTTAAKPVQPAATAASAPATPNAWGQGLQNGLKQIGQGFKTLFGFGNNSNNNAVRS